MNMKKFVLAVILFCAFSVHAIAIDTKDNDYIIEETALRILVDDNMNDIALVATNSRYEAEKAFFKANEAYSEAKLKDVQSYKVYATKTDVLKMRSIKADKAFIEACELLRPQDKLDKSFDEADNSAIKNKEIEYSERNIAKANAAKMKAILLETQSETTKSNSNEAVKLYYKAASFYDEASKAYGDIVIACSSTNTAIIRASEKVKNTKHYAIYENYVARRERYAEFWAKEQAYAKKLKEVSEAYARVAVVRIELANAVKAYAKAAKTCNKAIKVYAKIVKNSTEFPEADGLAYFEFEDAVELHKAHKISDLQLASVPHMKAANDTLVAYAAYCRTNSKFIEAVMAVCCAENEVVKLKTELNKSLLEQAQDIIQSQVECVWRY